MWEELQKVKLKNYIEYIPQPSKLPIYLAILLCVFLGVALGSIYGVTTSVSKLPYCDTYGEQMQGMCQECPLGKYCLDGRILTFGDEKPEEVGKMGFVESFKAFLIESIKVVLFFVLLGLSLFWANYRRVWVDKHIKIAERIYKELLLEMTNISEHMMEKSMFLRRLDSFYGINERRFLEEKLEEIRKTDEQITYLTENGYLYYVFTSN